MANLRKERIPDGLFWGLLALTLAQHGGRRLLDRLLTPAPRVRGPPGVAAAP